MEKRPLYFDYNATAPVRPAVVTLVSELIQTVGNASSVHSFGRAARKAVETARQQLDDFVSVTPEQIIFTSGATESLNTVLSAYQNRTVLISAIEHPAVLDSAPHAIRCPVTADGVVDLLAYQDLLKNHSPELVACMLVNSETGVIQPVREMCDMAHAHGALFLCDAVQAAGKIAIDFDALRVDFMALSAHKMGGLQGVGALIVRKGIESPKFMRGGGQERNARAGTHNTAGIAAMGLASTLATEDLKTYHRITALRDSMEHHVLKKTNKAVIYGAAAQRVGNTSNIGLQGVEAQTQLMRLDLEGIAVSSGSACSSGSFKPSHVLKAMGADDLAAKCALRISIGYATTQADMDAFLKGYDKILESVKQ